MIIRNASHMLCIDGLCDFIGVEQQEKLHGWTTFNSQDSFVPSTRSLCCLLHYILSANLFASTLRDTRNKHRTATHINKTGQTLGNSY